MIIISYGSDIVNNTRGALEASDIGKYLRPGSNVAIKPNLVVPGPASLGATTHPEVVEGIVLFLHGFGVGSIKIIESSWVGDSTARAFKYCGYEELGDKYGIPLIDLKKDTATALIYEGETFEVCDEALNTDFLINVPVLKAHCQTRLTCCMKNLKGCIPDKEKRRYHTLGIHKPVAQLSKLIKTGYNVVDGICGDLSFEEGGNPVPAGRIIAGRDALEIDSLCAQLIGYAPDEIGYLLIGKSIGVGDYYSEKTHILELNAEEKPVGAVSGGREAEKYSKLIEEESACSACYASAIYALHRLGGETGEAGKIHVGQGFRGKSAEGFGIGNCACGFTEHVPGCPPKATAVIDALKKRKAGS